MKVKTMPYLVFFLCSLGLALWASQPSEKQEQSGSEWINIPKSSIIQISYKDENNQAVLRIDETMRTHYWLDASEKQKVGEEEKILEDRFLVNDKITEVFNLLSPLRVEKIIGEQDKVKLEEFGLDKPVGEFVVQYGGDKTLKLLIGKRSFQSNQVFALDQERKIAILLDRKIINLLEKPKSRLALTKTLLMKEDSLAQVQVEQGKSSISFQTKKKGNQLVWINPKKPDESTETFRNWIEKIMRLQIEAYAKDPEMKGIDASPTLFQMSYTDDRGSQEKWTFLQDSTDGSKYWLRSDKIPRPVLVDGARVNVLTNDLKSLFGGAK